MEKENLELKDGEYTYLKEFQKKYPYMRIQDEETVDLVREAENYANIVWVKVDINYFKYLMKYLNMHALGDEYNTFNYYYKGLQGYCYVFEDGNGFYSIWFANSSEKVFKLIYKKILKYNYFCKKGLITALDPNYGGALNEKTKAVASLIIYG